MDQYVKDGALARDYIGHKMAEDFVNILDDPTLESEYGILLF